MAIGPILYSQDRSVMNLQAIEGGDASEIEARAAALFAAAASPSDIAEMVLCGTGVGPAWRLAFGFGSGAAVSIARSSAVVAAAVGRTPEEARGLLEARIAALGITTVYKVEMKGGGLGTSVMAVALGA